MSVLYRVFKRGIYPHRRYFWAAVATSLTLSALWVIEPLYGRYAIDKLLATENLETANLLRVLGLWLCIYIAINVVQGFTFYLRWKIQELLLTTLRQSYYEKILQLDIAHHVRSKSGELMKQIDNAADATVDMSRQVYFELSISFLTSLVFYVVSFRVSWQLASISISLLPVYLVLLSLSVWWTRKYSERINEYYVRAVGRGYDAITNIFTVKSSASEDRELARMSDLHGEALRESVKANTVWAILEGIGYFMILRILLTGIGIYLYAKGQLSLGSLFFFQFSFFRLVVPFEMLGNMMPRWNDRLEKIRMAEAIYAKDILVKSKPDAIIPHTLKGAISFKDISFSYGDADAIKNITLDIRPGEHLALVGHSGAGKSTVAMLLNRFYDVTDGAILVDGTDMRDLDVHWWRSQIGLVLQENITFNDTIKENIRYARPDATDEEIVDAATRASAHAFISKLPKGYDTLVGERGIRLSGGERQRVAIARAILKKPSIVVLDEATSALDSITEREVQNGIKSLIEGRTAVIIAHRLSTVRSVNRIAVLADGALIACAPHEELLKTCEVYKTMVELQQGGMLAE